MKTAEQKVAAWDKMIQDRKKYNEKKKTWAKLMLAKAAKAGIKVSDEEVAKAMKA